MSKTSQLSEFRLQGKFVGFAAPGAKLMQVATPTGNFTVKLAKALRPSLNRTLAQGTWVEVSGYQKLDDGKLKLKAERVLTLAPQSAEPSSAQMALATPPSPPSPRTTQPAPRKAEILVCQKSDCCKLGANALMRELQAELDERGIRDVKIRGTGCMKRCKAGPNLVMPDKSRYSHIKAKDVAALLDQQFPASSEMAS
ncbi:MAG: (2Fe-2S) ferredoxin domain-containing protein [Pegethrix bostrychoides GSE-TBD4-15B]|uniref:(2Fe-2S) ferredoxin domain-containing protein n=1 Tax=Pegethrix bostrychoides GSE-TBD4-15B TaxID=2839662 RepID=A0A951U2X5_9CYAN|nr:(2Fe-2S) ferredoxin domain-containing protein [Pegethrix bostrychoides GSE-TBD4-15B]